MRTLLVRFVVILLAVFLVAYVVPRLVNLEPPIQIGSKESPNWVTLIVFSVLLALVNSFIKPILKILTLPITCLTAGIFAIILNLLMFFLAAWITNQLQVAGGTVQVGWLGALIGAIAVGVVGWIMNVILPDSWEARR